MNINRNAPVAEVAEARVAAPLALVWQVQADLEGWPAWNPEVAEVELHGPLAPGTAFRWKAGGMRIVSELQEVKPLRSLAWTGRTLGIRAVHVWSFEENGEGTCVRTEESFEGWLPRIFRRTLGRTLRSSLESGLSALAAECERRVDERAGAEA